MRWLTPFLLCLSMIVARPVWAGDARLDQAWTMIDLEKWQQAESLAQAVLADAADRQDRFDAQSVLATISYYLDDIDAAMAVVQKLDDQAVLWFGRDAQQRIDGLELLGLLRSETGDMDGAMVALTRAVQIGRTHQAQIETTLFHLLQLAGLYGDHGDPRTAAVMAADVQLQASLLWGDADEIALEAGLMRALAHLDMGHPIEALIHAGPAILMSEEVFQYPVLAELMATLDAELGAAADGSEGQIETWMQAAVDRYDRRQLYSDEDIRLIETLDTALRGGDLDAAEQIAWRLTARALADDPLTIEYYSIMLIAQLAGANTQAAARWGRRIAGYPVGYLATLAKDFAAPLLELSTELARQRQYGQAVDLARLAWALQTTKEGPLDSGTLSATLGLADIQISAGQGANADATIAVGLDAIAQAGTRGTDTQARLMLLQSERAVARGEDDTAVRILESVLQMRAETGQTQDLIWTETLQALASLKLVQGQAGEAATLMASVRDLNVMLTGPMSATSHTSTVMLAVALFNDGQTEAAQQVFDEADQIYVQQVGADHPLRGALMLARSRMLRQNGDDDAANALFEQAAALTDAQATAVPDFQVLTQLATESWQTGRIEKAETYAQQALQAAPPEAQVLPTLWDLQARLALHNDDPAAALPWLRKLSGNLDRPGIAQRTSSRAHLPLHVEAALAVAAETEGAGSVALMSEAFGAAQSVNTLAAGDAFDRAASRWSAQPNLSERIRALQDSDRQVASLRARIGEGLAQGSSRVQELSDLSEHESAALDLRRAIEADFPDYAAFAFPRPASLARIAALLSPDEVLLIYATSDEMLPDGTEASQVIAVTQDTVQSAALAGASDLRALGADLRCAAALTDTSCGLTAGATRGSFSMDAPQGAAEPGLGFDLDLAHLAYQALLAPVAEIAAAKTRLIIVPDAAVISIPFNLLVKSAPAPDTNLRTADWVIRHQAITLMPTVTSFATLRDRARAPQTPRFLGIGDPLIGAQRDGPLDFDCSEIWGETVLALSRSSGGGGLSDLTALPDSRCELQASAAAFPGQADVMIQKDASEAALKTLSDAGGLLEFSAITFATHGLLAGQVGPFDAGLVLTPPDVVTATDNGLLTTSEVVDLRLNADVVILSACNTAAGSSENDEGLSGLASAFFYAGARSVMVSHWPVYSDAATRLSVATLTRMAGSGEGRTSVPVAEALRQSMLDILDDPNATPRMLHPSFWAPFLIAGGV